MIRGLVYDLPRALRGTRGCVLQRCSSLSHSGHVHGGVGARGVRGAVVGDHGSPVAFPGFADELVVTHFVAVATLDVLVGVGFPGAGRGVAGVLVGGGPVVGGLAVAAELIKFGRQHGFRFWLRYLQERREDRLRCLQRVAARSADQPA
jgi:hypothetical protein